MQTEEILAAGSQKSEAGGRCTWLCSATCQEYRQGNILPCSTSERSYFINLLSSPSLLMQLQYCRNPCSRLPRRSGPETRAERFPLPRAGGSCEPRGCRQAGRVSRPPELLQAGMPAKQLTQPVIVIKPFKISGKSSKV